MPRVGVRALLAGVISLGLASTAVAGTLDRTDVLDIDTNMFADKLDAPLTTNRAFLELSESSNTGLAFASGSVAAPGTGATTTRIFWEAFEPDQTKRSSDGGSLQQKDQVFMMVQLNGTVIAQGVTPGCKAHVTGKAAKGSPTLNKGDWSVNCNGKKAGAVLVLTDQQLTDLQTALGKKVVGKNSLNIKGKCTGTNCAPVL